MTVRPGRFGPYVNHGKINATLPKGVDPDTLALDQALELIAAKEVAGGGRSTRRGGASRKTKATGTTKPAAKKAAPRKAKPAKATSKSR